MTCRTAIGARERRHGECCFTCDGYRFKACHRVPMLGSKEVDPDFWCPSFALRGSLRKAASLGPVVVLRE